MSILTEKERQEALRELGFSETDHPSAEQLEDRKDMLLEKGFSPQHITTIEQAFTKLIENTDMHQGTYKMEPSPRVSNAKSDLCIFLEIPPETSREDFSKDFNQQLQANLNGLGLTPNSRYFVGGSPQSTMGIMSRNLLLMRCRFGSLFRTGGASIELTLEALAAQDPKELATEALTVIKACIENSERVKLFVKGTSSKLSAIFEALKSVAKTQGFNPKNVLNPEAKTEASETSERNFNPSPLSTSYKPFSFHE